VTNFITEYRRRIRKKAKKQKRESQRERDESAKDARVNKIIATIDSLGEHLDRRRDKSTSEKRSERRWQHAEVIGLWVAAAVGVGAIWVSSHDASQQLSAMQRQLDAMEADQRPWLRVITQIREPISITEWSGTKSITVPLRFNIENFGKSPAVNVRAYTTITRYLGVEHRKALAGLQRDTCEKGSAESDQDPIGGIPLFPSKTDKIEITPSILGDGIFRDAKPVMLAVYGCIDYTYSATKHGQTGFRFLLGRREGVYFSGFNFVEGQSVQYDSPIPDDLLKEGFPKNPPKVAKIPLDELIFRPEDSGNYAK